MSLGTQSVPGSGFSVVAVILSRFDVDWDCMGGWGLSQPKPGVLSNLFWGFP